MKSLLISEADLSPGIVPKQRKHGFLHTDILWGAGILISFSSCSPKQNYFLKKHFIYLFSERVKGRKRGKHQCVVASWAPPTGDLARNPGMCPTWESNR